MQVNVLVRVVKELANGMGFEATDQTTTVLQPLESWVRRRSATPSGEMLVSCCHA